MLSPLLQTSMMRHSTRETASLMSTLKGFTLLCYCLRIYLMGYRSRFSISCGTQVVLDAISNAAFSKEQKGLSRTMHCTFLFMLRAWLSTTDAPPMDLPHNTYLPQLRPASSHANTALTSSCSLSPQVVYSPWLRPLPEKSNAHTSYPTSLKLSTTGSASILLEPSPCAQSMQVSLRRGPLIRMVSSSSPRLFLTREFWQWMAGLLARKLNRWSWLQLQARGLMSSAASSLILLLRYSI